MKKIICLMAALMLLFSACGGNGAENNGAESGIVNDENGFIDEDKNNSSDKNADGKTDKSLADDAADGIDDITDGAADSIKDAVGGVENAVDDVTGNSKGDKTSK